MNIVNIGSDVSLVGGPQLGDAVERHRQYGQQVDHLDIIVYTARRHGLTETFIMADNVRGYPTNSFFKLLAIIDSIRIFKKINQNHQVDIIVCQDPFIPGLIGTLLKKKFGCKLQINFHGDFWGNPLWLKERWFNIFFLLLSKFTVPRADMIRVMSQGQKNKLLAAGLNEKKIRVIATPVNLEKFSNYENQKPEHKKQIENLIEMQRGRRMILMVGRKDKVKDFPTLFKAMNLVYNENERVGLWLVGNYRVVDIKNFPLPKSMKDEGIFASGGIDSNDLPAYYKASYLTVLSSTSESFGKVIVEANACGKAVVATATTGAQEIIKDGHNGFLVPIGDARTLADRIKYLLDNPDQAKAMGENGRKLVYEKFSRNTEKIINLWQDLMKL